ncbi:hypothetical protein [Xylanivirga thermophila]|uniref:hypothetical protein n=1 Tax=Xylanivirga thermophila TaxID=2496273 RepID=UPI00101BE60E|nr:hypothetical protein [Xylanivirga thermophila]
MIQKEIEKKIRSMDKRKLLFLFGEHLSGKTRAAIGFLKSRYEDEYSKYYIDVGLYLQQKILEGSISKYRIYPEEFSEDAQDFIEELINEKFVNNPNSVYVLDHLEFLLSEKSTDWIKVLARVTLKKHTVIVIVPNEYRNMMPVKAYDYIEIV